MHIAIYAESERGPVWVKSTRNPRATLQLLQAENPKLRLLGSVKVGQDNARAVLAWLSQDWRHRKRTGRLVSISAPAALAAVRNAAFAVQSMPKESVAAFVNF